MAVIRILDYAITPSVFPERRGKQDLTVSYSVDNVRFYRLALPAEEYLTPEGKVDADKLFERVKAEERERLKIIGKTFEV